MDFWTDIAFAVILRILKDRKQSANFATALLKIGNAIEVQRAFLEEVAAREKKVRP